MCCNTVDIAIRLECVHFTPLLFPVVPEEYMRAATSDWETRVGIGVRSVAREARKGSMRMIFLQRFSTL